MLHFLIVLFEKTKSVLESDLKEANTRAERIIKFREYMTTGQNFFSVGQNRQRFYEAIVDGVKAVSRVCRLCVVFLQFTEDSECEGP